MIILFKYCVDVENCENFRRLGYIYTHTHTHQHYAPANQNSYVNNFYLLIYLKLDNRIDNENK